MKKISLLFLIFFCTCSTQTLYNIEMDLLSFLDEFKTEQSITVPPLIDLSLFLFPEVEVSTSGGPNEQSQKGLLICFPTQDSIDLNSFSVKLEIETEIKNNSQSEQITGDRISLYIAPTDAENIYLEGIKFDLINIETIYPLESSVYLQEFILDEDESLLEILKDGRFRMGIGIHLASTVNFIPVFFRLNRITISTTFSSLDLLVLRE